MTISRRTILAGIGSSIAIPTAGLHSTSAQPRQIPLEISHRPFAIEPYTNLMLPDGIFDNAIYFLDIAFYVTNVAAGPLSWFWVRPAPDPVDWAYVGANMFQSGPVPSGGSVLVRWRANFRECSPGKKSLPIEFGAQLARPGLGGGFDGIFRTRIFVSSTRYEERTRLYTCRVPEGELKISFLRKSYVPGLLSESPEGQIVTLPPTFVPTKIDALVLSRAGNDDALPFSDPWWKIIAWVVAVIAGIAAIIAAKEGQGSASIAIGGEGHDNPLDYDYCIPDPTAHKNDELTLAGALSILCSAAMRVGMMDNKDPWQKGREAFPSIVGNSRVSEQVKAEIAPPAKISAGTRYQVPIDWEYVVRRQRGDTDVLVRKEVGDAEQYLALVNVNATSQAHRNGTIRVQLQLALQNGRPAAATDIYGFAVFVSPEPDNRVFRVPFQDDALVASGSINAGVFSAQLELERLQHLPTEKRVGKWRISLYVQRTNTASTQMSPLEAATYVGGDLLVAPVHLTTKASEGPEHCQPDKTIEVVVS